MIEIPDSITMAAYLHELDNYLQDHWHNMTGNDVFELWRRTQENVRNYRGTTALFTAHMAELLILRFLIHQLGSNFQRQPIVGRGVDMFLDENNHLAIFPNRQQDLGDGRYWRPDFSLYQGDQLIAVVEVKTGVHRMAELDDVSDRLNHLCAAHGETRGAFVHFYGLPPHVQLANYPHLIFLNNNHSQLANEFNDKLGLNQ